MSIAVLRDEYPGPSIEFSTHGEMNLESDLGDKNIIVTEKSVCEWGLRYADLAKTTPRIKLRLVSDSSLLPESEVLCYRAVTRQEQLARELAT